MDNRLRRQSGLTRKRDFERVLFRGRRLKRGPVGLYFAPNPEGNKRAAFIATGRFRTAVARNRVRRRLREIFRTNQQCFPAGFDFILRGEPPVAELEFSALKDEILRLTQEVSP